ncbi:unnamed protein product [Caenorhabditis brenneri]
MPEEYIMSSKACVYVLGGADGTAALFDFDGVYLLDGGFAEKSQGFVANVREVTAVLLSAPTIGNLGTTSALLSQDKPVSVVMNTKPLKGAKAGSSGELVKAIQEANSKLLHGAPLLFDPKYPAHIIYQSFGKGVLSLYILAGDAKDAEVITKALASGNEAEVEKAAAAHGTVGVLLWRPANADKQVVRVLVSGTCPMSRIQQSLDKAAKSLPFLNAASVKSKDALTAIPAPSLPRPSTTSAKPTSAKPAGATRPTTSGPAARSTNSSTTAAPRALTARAPAPNGNATRAAPKPAPTKAAPTKTAPPAARATKAPAPAAKAPVPKAPVRAAPPKPAAPSRGAAPKPSEPIAQKKTVGKVQAKPAAPAAASAPKKAPEAAAPTATIPAAATTARVPVPEISEPAAPPAHQDANVTITLDDSEITMEDMNQGGGTHGPMDIVVIPPTPEPPRHEEEHKEEPAAVPEPPKEIDDVANLADVEDEIPQPVDAFKKPSPEPSEQPQNVEDEVPQPVDAFKKPSPEPHEEEDHHTPAYPKIGDLDDFDPLKPHPEPSAPEVPHDHVIISTPDPNLPDIAAAVPFVPPVPLGGSHLDDGLITLDDDVVKIAPGFEEPLIPQATQADGTLADCSEEFSKLVEISMDTDKSMEAAGVDLSEAIGDVTKMTNEVQKLSLDEKTDEYVRKLSNQMVEDATMPFTSALASSIVSSNGSQDHSGSNGHTSSSNGTQDHQKELPKHDLMQARSSVIENGAPVEYEKTDPALDDILNACAQESEKLDAAASSNAAPANNSEVLHMPSAPGSAIAAKPVKFARPYYFDVVTVPRNEKLEATLTADDFQEFISKIRSRNVILASKDISSEQLQGLLTGKQYWCDSAHPCTIIPTHSSPILVDFRQKNEAEFANNHLTFTIPVEKQRTTVSSERGAAEYELAKISLE